MSNSNLNLISDTRAYIQIPYKCIDKNSPTDLRLNITSFSVNDITIGSNDFAALGYNFPIANNVRTQDKSLTINYMPSESLIQYIFLHTWLSKIANEDGSGLDSTVKSFDDYTCPIRITLLSAYKTPILEITYENAWIYNLGKLDFDYQDPQASIIKNSFSVKYSKQTFKTLI